MYFDFMLTDTFSDDVVPGFFDLIFVFVSEIEENSFFMDEFFVNEHEYALFAKSLKTVEGELTGHHPYDYEYRSARIEKEAFIKYFHFGSEERSIDELNVRLKNVAIHRFESLGKAVDLEYKDRIIVNDYFDERKYIFEKTNERFDFSFPGLDKPKESVIFRMYNVGQANMSALFVGEKDFPEIIFDLGEKKRCNEAIDLLQNRLPLSGSGETTTIVISHYHDDHIKMAKYIPQRGRSLRFICPQLLHSLDFNKPNIQTLLDLISNNGYSACFFPNDSIKNPIKKRFVTFLQGSKVKRDSNQNESENSHGLITLLTINGKKVLIPGDALYGDIFTRLNSPLKPDYVLIPHHACEYNGPINPKIIDLSKLKESFTFCGPHSGHHHPNKTHFDQYLVNDAKAIRLANPSKPFPIVFDGKAQIVDEYYLISFASHYDWKLR